MNGIIKKVVYIGNPNQTRHLNVHHEKAKERKKRVEYYFSLLVCLPGTTLGNFNFDSTEQRSFLAHWLWILSTTSHRIPACGPVLGQVKPSGCERIVSNGVVLIKTSQP